MVRLSLQQGQPAAGSPVCKEGLAVVSNVINDTELLHDILGIPEDFTWNDSQRTLAASRLRNWVSQYGEDVIREKRRGFLLTLSNQGLESLRNYL